MATKTIISDRYTLHVPGPGYKPEERDGLGGFLKLGKYDVIHVKPKTPVTMEEGDADKLIAAGIATVYEAVKAVESVSTVVATAVVAPANNGGQRR